MNIEDKAQIVNKYMNRDLSLSPDYRKNIYENAMTKLGYNPEKFNKYLLNSYKFYCDEIINNEHKNEFKNNVEFISFDEFKLNNQEKINEKNQRYQELNKYKDDIRTFYEALTISELNYLGY